MHRLRPTALVASLVLLVVTQLAAAGSADAASFRVAPGRSAPTGPGSPIRYTVEVERGIAESPASVARQVEDRMADHRGWGAGFRRSFQRVSTGRHDVRMVLASAATTQRMCLPLDVVRYWNCYQRGVVVLNHDRWLQPAPTYGRRIGEYRTLMVMHEFGHALGHGHASCPRAGAFAPPMMQQGKGLQGCRRNPWPSPTARRLRSRCTIDVERIRDTRVVRVRGSAEWVGTPVVLRVFERSGGRWRGVRARRTDSTARSTWLIRTDVTFLRVAMPGTASRRACSAVASVTARSTARS
ncbi:MAG: DUF3152 domain-containing protein [Thermoleophilia bacterium]|nr:DUF3152 domain-containing protein [Thermoleophilia bacterium]